MFSTTTILRFCKKVGCEGYSEFRLKLKQEVSSKEQKKINMDLTAVKDFFERVQTRHLLRISGSCEVAYKGIVNYICRVWGILLL